MANADWSKPTSSSHYLSFQDELKSRDVDAATQYHTYSGSNQPTGAIRWNTSSNRWNRWDGSSWVELTDTYALTSVSVENNSVANGLNTQSSNLALFTNSTQRLQLNSSGAFGFGTAGLGGSNFGTAGQFLVSAGSSGVPVWTSVTTGGLIEGYGLFCDEQNKGISGGTFTSGSWISRDLNTTIAKEGFAFDPSSNRLQLTTVSGGVTTPAKFIICWRAPAFDVGRHQTRAILAATTSPFNSDYIVGYGQNAFSNTTAPSNTMSCGCAYLELPLSGNSSDDRVELIIQHQCSTTRSSVGLGADTDFGVGDVSKERYAFVEVYKLKD